MAIRMWRPLAFNHGHAFTACMHIYGNMCGSFLNEAWCDRYTLICAKLLLVQFCGKNLHVHIPVYLFSRKNVCMYSCIRVCIWVFLLNSQPCMLRLTCLIAQERSTEILKFAKASCQDDIEDGRSDFQCPVLKALWKADPKKSESWSSM